MYYVIMQLHKYYSGIFKTLYSDVGDIYTFIAGIQLAESASRPEVVRLTDNDKYKNFLKELIICIPQNARPLPKAISFQQLSSQKEVVARIIQRLCEKKQRNVLASGYACADEKSSLLIKFAVNICSYQPNPTTAMISTSPLWETLLNRIGDDVMMYLLENCSLFMHVPPSCCYQISGVPIYSLISSDLSLGWARQRPFGTRYNVLLKYIQKKRQLYRKKWKDMKESQRGTRVVDGRNTCNARNVISSSQMYQRSNKTTRLSQVSDEQKNIVGDVPVLDSTERSLKRCRNKDGDEDSRFPARKFRKSVDRNTVHLASTCTDTSVLCKIPSYPLVDPALKNLVPGAEEPFNCTVEVCQSGTGSEHMPNAYKVMETKCLGQQVGYNETELQSQDNVVNNEVTDCPANPGIDKVGTVSSSNVELSKPFKQMISKHDSKNKMHKNKIKFSEVYIKIGCIMYSNKSLRECFPKTFSLHRFVGYQNDGQRLIEKIFLDSSVFGNKTVQKLSVSHWRKKRLPKRYWQMRTMFQSLLKNHKRCPYLMLCRRNCPVTISCAKSRGRAVEHTEKQYKQSDIAVHRSSADASSAVCSVTRDEGQQQLPQPRTVEDIDRETSQVKEVTAAEIKLRSLRTVQLDMTGGSKDRSLAEASANCEMPAARLGNDGRCVLTSESQRPNTALKESDPCLQALLQQHSSPQQVYGFLRECLIRVVPEELWGSSHNKCRFLKNVKKFISMGKFDQMSLPELLWKMRVNDCTWLQLHKGQRCVPAAEHLLREEILAKFLYWLMNTYIIQLLRSFFYVTETMFQKNRLFFYRKSVWRKLQENGVRNHLSKVKLHHLSEEEVEAMQLRQNPVISRLRFIPKINGLRPIVKLEKLVETAKHNKETSKKKVQKFNTQLKNLFSVLNYERIRNPTLLGSSVFGLDDIYKVWKKFVLEKRKPKQEMPHFYFVKADVTGAYDTIPHNKLIEVISQIIGLKVEENYCVRRYAVVWSDALGQLRKSYKRHVSTMIDFLPGMKQFVSNLQQSASLQSSIFIEQGLNLNETSSNLFCFFNRIICNSAIRINDSYYRQCCGIPQGSILSTLLCSLCYGDMENKLFCGIQQDGVLLRLIDDFLLVTPHLCHAETFLRTLASGIPEYGCSISLHKTVVNFPVVEEILGCFTAKQLPSHCLFPWCGLLLDTKTLEVYCDYSSYACTSITSSLTFNYSNNGGHSMRRKLLAVLRLKCHGIFLDLQVNTLRTVCINIYKIFLLQAYRFHACVIRLPFGQGVNNNPSFFLMVISSMAPCCYSIFKAKNRGAVLGTRDASGPFPFEAAQWLCYHAFIVKLSSHKAVYKRLLGPLLTCKLQVQKKLSKEAVELLKSVTLNSLYKEFSLILD
ncbi:telomerase reverse transcriptase [Protopterus annectens]|uniref:telomerase reverse transcriptase n=1 Tax=Protopterus annectens TaxID=7888 RepID=UPI001CF9B313|nr:telomerase reverse transcriptase [Protopterus annectens]